MECANAPTRYVGGAQFGFCALHFERHYGFACDSCHRWWNGFPGFKCRAGGDDVFVVATGDTGVYWNGKMFHGMHFCCVMSGTPLLGQRTVYAIAKGEAEDPVCNSCENHFVPGTPYPVYRMTQVLLPPWSKGTHLLFPKPFREVVFTILLIAQRQRELRDVLYVVISHLGALTWRDIPSPKMISSLAD